MRIGQGLVMNWHFGEGVIGKYIFGLIFYLSGYGLTKDWRQIGRVVDCPRN